MAHPGASLFRGNNDWVTVHSSPLWFGRLRDLRPHAKADRWDQICHQIDALLNPYFVPCSFHKKCYDCNTTRSSIMYHVPHPIARRPEGVFFKKLDLQRTVLVPYCTLETTTSLLVTIFTCVLRNTTVTTKNKIQERSLRITNHESRVGRRTSDLRPKTCEKNFEISTPTDQNSHYQSSGVKVIRKITKHHKLIWLIVNEIWVV